ncbi:MAG: NAD-dependent epimerase/dehydratase family protein [Planctomycetes bacterium]|nr:NAD-dependent epimerase/dehydratase family protein [Planctomycetota bacterium]
MKALITGGAGFIGSHLAERLIGTGHDVIVIDDLSTGSLENIKGLKGHPKFRFVLDSVHNTETMHILIEQCDIVYHLAAAVGVQLIVDEPVRTIETNIHGTEVVLAVANKFRKKVLLASSSEVYGKSEAIPFQEDDDTVYGSTMFSRWSYACSKAIDEFLGLAYFEQYELPVVVGRFFNTVGPRQTGQYGMVIPRFVEKALKNEPIVIYGDGKQTRTFAYVGDVTDAVINLMNSPAAPGRVYNIGSQEEISIEGLANKIIEKTGSTAGIEFISYEQAYGKPFDDMMRRVPNLDRIRETIGYEHKTSLDQILTSVIEHFQNNLK